MICPVVAPKTIIDFLKAAACVEDIDCLQITGFFFFFFLGNVSSRHNSDMLHKKEFKGNKQSFYMKNVPSKSGVN